MPNTSSHRLHDRVQALFDRLVDIGHGYDLITDQAPASIRSLVVEIAEQHLRDIEDIDRLASDRDISLDRDCTDQIAGDQIALRLRDVFADDDRNTLDSIVIGEEMVVKRYDEAIACLSPDDELHTVLTGQRDALRQKVAQIFEAV
ncbi:MAG: hypothetical protein ACEPO2_03570 [Pelagibaca sp.]